MKNPGGFKNPGLFELAYAPNKLLPETTVQHTF